MGGLDNMRKRMLWDGGGAPHSDGRNVSGKYRSFQSALWNSYQAEWISFKCKKWRCLINPDKETVDYDQKEISISFDAEMKTGDTFYWDRTNHYWMAFMEKYEEEAYFRAGLRRCDYEIDCGENKYPIYVRGPVETALVWRQKHKIEMNDMNYSILFYIKKNEETDAFLTRFKVLKFDGHNWRVVAVDRYTQPGIIEVYLEEYFDNEMEDKMILPEIIEPDTTQPYISGPQLVKPFDTNVTYSIVGLTGGSFVVNSSKVKVTSSTSSSCVLEIITGKSSSFTIKYIKDSSEVTLPVTIQSL